MLRFPFGHKPATAPIIIIGQPHFRTRLAGLFALLILPLLLASCDCYKIKSGTITDKESGKPMAGVLVYDKDDIGNRTESDTAGHFELSRISGDFDCPSMIVVVAKEGYIPYETSTAADGEEAIQLQRSPVSQATLLRDIKDIFEQYVDGEESTDTKEHKATMRACIESLNVVKDAEGLTLLINVWMYYDPTDFPGRQLVFKVLRNSSPQSTLALQQRIDHKKNWEERGIAPYSELFYLLQELSANQ